MNIIEKLGIEPIKVYGGAFCIYNQNYCHEGEVREIEQQRNDAFENLYEACEVVCELCVRLNPNHKDCRHCDELDDLRKPITDKAGLLWQEIKALL